MTATLVQRAGEPAAIKNDAMWRNIKRDIDTWAVSWMQANGLDLATQGIVEEYGWTWTADTAHWPALGEQFLQYLDTLGLPRCSWGAGRFWASYFLGCWVNPTSDQDLNTARPNALVYEQHLGNARSGACVSGGEKTGGGSAGDPAGGGVYSSLNPGVYGTDYRYPSAQDFVFLKSRGVQLARVMVKHERIQPAGLGQPLNATEVARLRTVLDNAGSAGVKVIFCPWNGSRYKVGLTTSTYEQWVWSLLGSRTTDSFGNILGSYTTTLFADFWQRMATALHDHPALHGYSLANEPGEADEFGTPSGSSLVTIGDMEAGTGWTGTHAALTYDTSNQRSGTQAAKLVADGTGGPSLDQNTAFVVTPNMQYQLSAYVKAPVKVEQWTAQINWSTSGGSFISSSTANFPNTVAGSYVQILGGVTAPATAGKAQVKVHAVPGTDTAGTVFYIDDVTLLQNTFFAGGTVVEQFTQAAVTAIRTVDTTHEIWVAGFGNGPLHWHDYHTAPWITDATGKFRYSIHYYFDVLSHNSGSYTASYAAEAANSVAAGF